jgi:hypothetical protein
MNNAAKTIANRLNNKKNGKELRLYKKIGYQLTCLDERTATKELGRALTMKEMKELESLVNAELGI